MSVPIILVINISVHKRKSTLLSINSVRFAQLCESIHKRTHLLDGVKCLLRSELILLACPLGDLTYKV